MNAPIELPARAQSYSPVALLDLLKRHFSAKNDAQLARSLELDPAVICRVRQGLLPISGALVIRAHELTGLSIGEIRAVMGDRRRMFRTRSRVAYQSAPDAPASNVTRLPVRQVAAGGR